MEQILELIENLKSVQIIDLVVALCIMTLFKALSSSIAFGIVKIFKFKRSKKQIKESAFYRPLKVFIGILGVYLGVLFLKRPLNITQEVMSGVTKVFQIISTIAFSRALAESFTVKSSLVKGIRDKWRDDVDDSMLKLALRFVRAGIYIVAILIILAILKINLSGLVAGAGILSVVITLAAQDTAKNIFGGVVLFIDKPFGVGDWIETPNYQGVVEDITFRTTRIRNFEDSVVNIPNSTIADVAIINWSKMGKRKYKVNLPFSFETTSEQIEYIKSKIKESLIKDSNVINEDVVVSFNKIADTNIMLLIETFLSATSYKDYCVAIDKINREIMDIVHDSKAKLAYPASTVYVGKEEIR